MPRHRATALSGSCDLLILDEIMAAINSGMVEAEQVKQLLCGKPEELEVVLTGRNPPEELIELADYVSQIQKVKHPFAQRNCCPRRYRTLGQLWSSVKN